MAEKELIIAVCPSCGAQTPIESDKPLLHFTCAACGKHHEAKVCVGCEFSEGCAVHGQLAAP